MLILPSGGPFRALALLLPLLPSGCGRPEPPPAEVVIGFPFPGWAGRNVVVAREELASWEGPGLSIHIVYDSASNQDDAATEVERAARFAALPGIVGIVGHGGSRGSLAAAPIYNEARLPQIVPTGTSRALAGAGPWTFLLAPNDSVLGESMVGFLHEELEARRVTLFYENDEYGTGLRAGLLPALAERGIEVVDQVPYSPGSDLPTLVALSLGKGAPDLLIIAGRQHEAGPIIGEAHRRRPELRFLAGDGVELTPILEGAAGAGLDSLYLVTFWHHSTPDSLSRAFVERYRRLNGGETPQAAHAMRHDALLLLARATREAGPSPGRIRRYLEELGGGRLPAQGVTGPLHFREDRPPRLVVIRARDNRVLSLGSP